MLFIKICLLTKTDTMNNSDATLPSEATIPEHEPQPEFPLRLDVMYDGVHYIFKSTEEMVAHIAFLERKKKIIQRVRERHQNSQKVVDAE
jgi:hypothetical protein